MMTIHEIQQGTDLWHQFRLQHFGASECAAMLGMSRQMTRTELLHAKHTNVPREFSDWVQRHILDKGHELEAKARPIIESRIGEELYPVTCSRGRLSASCDGLTLAGDLAFEHKQWSESLASAVSAGAVPDEHMPQCQQIMLVTGASKVLFVVSDGTEGRMVQAEVLPDKDWFARIKAGWKQFEADLAAFVPQPVAIAAVGRAPTTLPALRIEVTGAVTASNLDAFKSHALQVFKDIKIDLQTDQDFADAEKTVKWCGDVEDRLAAAKQHALSQTESIDALFRAIDEIAAEAKAKRLHLDKVVKARKETIRGEIVAEGVTALAVHIRGLNERIGKAYMPPQSADFGGAIKGKRTVASLRDAVNTTLAAAKIAASDMADRITLNLKALAEHEQHASLFPDEAAIVLKTRDDFAALVKARISDHVERERLAQEARDKAAEAQRKADEESEAARQRAITPAAPVATAAAIEGKADNPGSLVAAPEAAPTTLEEAALAYGTASPEYAAYFARWTTTQEPPLRQVNPAPHAEPPLAATPGVTVRIGVNGLTEAETAATAAVAGLSADFELRADQPTPIVDEVAAAEIAGHDFSELGPEEESDDEGGIDAGRADAIRDRALDLKVLVDQARASKFPAQPKMGPEWFAALYAAVDALAAEVG